MTECGMKRYWTFFLCCLAGLCPSLDQTVEETQQVKGTVGESAAFPAPVFRNGFLLFKDLGNIAMVFKGSSNTELKDQFRGRLKWDSKTGLFTITQLRTEDSGEYKVDNTDEQKLTRLQLEVYKQVSTPTVTVAAVRRLNCSVLCSVENGREVTLSWQREGETLSHTSSPDLNTNLSLPLEIGGPKHTYICEVKNPVSSQRHLLDIPENCTESSGETQEPDRHRSYVIPIAAACSLTSVLATLRAYPMLQSVTEPLDSCSQTPG
ncbi:hypothetical protein MATL_G00221440 [Megalops atlanticus]|uniref:Ig-like domain-containing protein n=1 Tax=Megalops atlanticus TaxID=7932 RepID=A0A9D3T2L0_MEGAT|nr:hypothetical protein MATL_G00221440 [Megalops atlanticus]